MKNYRSFNKPQGIFLPVEKLPTESILSTGCEVNPQMKHAIVVDVPKYKKNPAHKRVVNFCSGQYNLVKNEDVIKPLESIFKDEGFEIEAKYSMTNFCRFFVDYVIKNNSTRVVKGDNVFPKIRLQNSYDGKLRLTFDFGLYRLICSNGLSVPVVGGNKALKLTHTPYSSSVNALEEAVGSVKEFMGALKPLIEPFKEMAAKTLEEQEALEVVQKIIKDTRYPAKQLDNVMANLKREQESFKLAQPNLWVLYNAMNSVLCHNFAIGMDFNKRNQVDTQVLRLILTKYAS